MRKYIGIIVFIGLFVASPALADNLYGFLDGKLYDTSGTLKYICFMDGNCLADDGAVKTRLELVGSATMPTYEQAVSTPYNENQNINVPQQQVQQPIVATPVDVVAPKVVYHTYLRCTQDSVDRIGCVSNVYEDYYFFKKFSRADERSTFIGEADGHIAKMGVATDEASTIKVTFHATGEDSIVVTDSNLSQQHSFAYNTMSFKNWVSYGITIEATDASGNTSVFESGSTLKFAK